MLPGFLLSLREGLEAALIIGIVLGALRKMNRTHLNPVVWRGVLAAAVASLVGAVALSTIGARFEGRAEAIFEGTAMLTAAILLTWMIVWMRRQSASLQQNLEADVRVAARGQGGQGALFWLAFLAVGREGFELALFLIATRVAAGGLQTVLGAAVGLAGAAVLGWLLFSSTYRLSLRQFFAVTNVLLVLFAAGLVAHGVHEFNEAAVIPAVVEHVWDTNGFLDETSLVGQMLKALFGYNGNPSLTEVLAYVTYFGGLALFWNRMARPAPAMEAA